MSYQGLVTGLAVCICFMLHSTKGNVIEIFEGVQQRDLSGLVGETIQLPCSVNTDKCGDLHSIKWYRGTSRIYVFSEMANIARSEGDYTDRAELLYTPNSTVSHLKVKQLQVADEAVYKCEITYLEVREGCQVVQFIHLTTLIKPEFVRIIKGDGTELANASMIGPLNEDDYIILMCESGGGKPIPAVSWWNGTEKIEGEYEVESGANGIGLGRNRIRVTVSRGDLGARYECKASNDALETPMISWVELDVNVRPLRLSLTGVKNHVVQGTKVVLQCTVTGARPAANITWYNMTKPIPTSNTTKVQADGTYETQSQLVFIASRFEDGSDLSCEGSNAVMQQRKEEVMRESIKLEVLYPPIVTVFPDNITVNESDELRMLCDYKANPATIKSVRWMRDNVEVQITESTDSKGEHDDKTSLTIQNATRHDRGAYTCILENEVGTSTSDNSVYVSIYFKPTVNLTMYPPTPVSELDHQNITLQCQVVSGNPDTLLAVRWYLNGELLKELPECAPSTNYTFCDIDPSKLLLENVEKSFHGNYSCIGMNEAGWGNISPNTELIVYYPPGRTTLTYAPLQVKKRESVTLSCSIDDPGRPDNATFRWTRGSHTIQDVTTANWTIDPVTLETESNFTCTAVNEGGESESSTVYIKVFAPPTFIERLPPYYGALMNAQQINLTCRVECSPLCTVNWAKNGRPLEVGTNSRYTVRNTLYPPDTRTNDFESVQSTLIFNMSAWPGNQLDRIADNANYSCHSTGNAAGGGIRSTTFFGVEYPPENLTVSNKVVNVIEGNVPEKVLCNAKAVPEASYQWRREGDSDVIVKGNALTINYPVPRRNGGNYICEAFNRHGNNTQKTFINVLYKPECGITQTEEDGKLILICTANANPTDVDFTWKIKNENETIEENIRKDHLKSYLTLETQMENFRTYLCFANNSVGMSIPCERDVTGNISWWRRLESDNYMIILAIIAGAILMVIIICIIIIIVCRRKRAADKCPNPSATKDKSDLNSSPSDALLQADPDNKAFYENLPFHGMQNPPNKPFRPEYTDLDYADVDYRSYGPINYKAASIYAAAQKMKNNNNHSEDLL